jgi:hypothetical protein
MQKAVRFTIYVFSVFAVLSIMHAVGLQNQTGIALGLLFTEIGSCFSDIFNKNYFYVKEMMILLAFAVLYIDHFKYKFDK